MILYLVFSTQINTWFAWPWSNGSFYEAPIWWDTDPPWIMHFPVVYSVCNKHPTYISCYCHFMSSEYNELFSWSQSHRDWQIRFLTFDPINHRLLEENVPDFAVWSLLDLLILRFSLISILCENGLKTFSSVVVLHIAILRFVHSIKMSVYFELLDSQIRFDCSLLRFISSEIDWGSHNIFNPHLKWIPRLGTQWSKPF